MDPRFRSHVEVTFFGGSQLNYLSILRGRGEI